ncbi:hypothetical protein P8452_25395 [Trifolium repens]|nr:hypothetical protein P8452_25395 [Trifolium repens]
MQQQWRRRLEKNIQWRRSREGGDRPSVEGGEEKRRSEFAWCCKKMQGDPLAGRFEPETSPLQVDGRWRVEAALKRWLVWWFRGATVERQTESFVVGGGGGFLRR